MLSTKLHETFGRKNKMIWFRPSVGETCPCTSVQHGATDTVSTHWNAFFCSAAVGSVWLCKISVKYGCSVTTALVYCAQEFDRHVFTIHCRLPHIWTWCSSCHLNRSNQHRIYLPAVWWISFTHKRPERGCSLYRWTTFLQNKSLRFLCVCGACASDIPVAADFSLSRSLLS